jgi:hypothetical protein
MTSPMPPSAGNVLSEKDALAELLAWAKDRPKWQQDALRRLVLNDALTEVDIDDLVGICLDPNAPSQPITSAHVAAEGASGEPIALLRIENPTGINALAIDQKLEFAKDGLTVIYGDNGSGKSGRRMQQATQTCQPLAFLILAVRTFMSRKPTPSHTSPSQCRYWKRWRALATE